MLQRMVHTLAGLLQKVAGVLLVAMMALTCTDVLSGAFGLPILGAEEMVSLMASVLLAFVLPMAHLKKAHIGIDLLYRHFGPLLRKINDLFISLISLVFFILVSWQCILYAREMERAGEVSSTLQLPFYYILYAIGAACFVVVLVLVMEIVALLRRNRDG